MNSPVEAFIPIKTRVVNPPIDTIWDIIDSLDVKEDDIIFITSKILAIHQGRTVPMNDINKEQLIKNEADYWLPCEHRGGFRINLTITDNVLIPAAGIDESNANGHYIMWPKDIDGLCAEIRLRLVDRHGLKNLGVVATDSHTTPLRWGVTGITIGLAGVEPLEDIRGRKDIFGRDMKMTQINKIDPLTSMAVLLMGEADETVPIVILRGFDNIKFNEKASMQGYKISPDDDIYQPLLDA